MKQNSSSYMRSNKQKIRKKNRVITDESLMKIPMSSTANDLNHVTELLNSGTKEIQDILKHECVLIYECKVCRGLFRSIINFVIHKRKYCVAKFSVVNHKDLSSKLQQVEELCKTSPNNSIENGKSKPMRSTQPPNLSSFYQSLISKTLGNLSADGDSTGTKLFLPEDIIKLQSATVILDKLETTNLPQVTSTSPDLNKLLSDSSTAVLREDGTIATNINTLEELYKTDTSSHQDQNHIQSNNVARNNLFCSLCKFMASSKTELYKHAQINHFTFYKCHQCGKQEYHSVYAVLRHLYEVHKVTKARQDPKYKKKVLASKLVKSIPKSFYNFQSQRSSEELKENSRGAANDNVQVTKFSHCKQCSSVFQNVSSNNLLCSGCNFLESKRNPIRKNPSESSACTISDSSSVISDDTPKPILQSSRFTRSSFSNKTNEMEPMISPAKYLLKSSFEMARYRMQASPLDGKKNQHSPIKHLSEILKKRNEENEAKAGIQVRMDYNKGTPGNPVVLKIDKTNENSEKLNHVSLKQNETNVQLNNVNTMFKNNTDSQSSTNSCTVIKFKLSSVKPLSSEQNSNTSGSSEKKENESNIISPNKFIAYEQNSNNTEEERKIVENGKEQHTTSPSNISKTIKRKNLDSITEKLLQNKKSPSTCSSLSHISPNRNKKMKFSFNFMSSNKLRKTKHVRKTILNFHNHKNTDAQLDEVKSLVENSKIIMKSEENLNTLPQESKISSDHSDLRHPIVSKPSQLINSKTIDTHNSIDNNSYKHLQKQFENTNFNVSVVINGDLHDTINDKLIQKSNPTPATCEEGNKRISRRISVENKTDFENKINKKDKINSNEKLDGSSAKSNSEEESKVN